MQKAYPIFILLSVMGLIMGALYTYIHVKEKNKNPFFIISAISWFLLPVLSAIGILLHSEKLLLSALFFPISAFLIATCIEHFVRHKKCTVIVSAKCVSFEMKGRSPFYYYVPQFSYNYNGEAILAYSFASYLKRKFKKLFEIGGTYDIFIDPQNPKHCVDKRCFPMNNIFILILGIIFLFFGAFVVISI